MSTGESARMRGHMMDIHLHGEPAESSGVPATGVEAAAGSCTGHAAVGRLWREDGRLLYAALPGDEPQPVRILWARPLSDRGGPVSVMQAGKKREVAYIPDLALFDDASRAVAEKELSAGMVLPVITAIYEVKPRFGNYYWDVETNLGRRRFLLSSPETNATRPHPDGFVIKDVSGNCYEIPAVSKLDKSSRQELDRAL